jgi:hypothetical protein
MEVSGQLYIQATLFPGIEPVVYPSEVEPQNWSEHSARKEDTSLTLPETETLLSISDYAQLSRLTKAST